MARDGHGLPKVSPRPAIAYPSTPCGQAMCYPFGHPPPYAHEKDLDIRQELKWKSAIRDRPLQEGVSKGEEDGRKAVWAVTRLQSV